MVIEQLATISYDNSKKIWTRFVNPYQMEVVRCSWFANVATQKDSGYPNIIFVEMTTPLDDDGIVTMSLWNPPTVSRLGRC